MRNAIRQITPLFFMPRLPHQPLTASRINLSHILSRVVAAPLLVLIAGVSCLSAAGPSDKNPTMLLTPWTDESVSRYPVEAYSSAAELYTSATEDIESYETKIENGNVKSLNLLKVGMTAAVLSDLEQYAARLVTWGEPAGHDLRLRADELKRRLNKITTAMATPFADVIAKGLPVLQNRCQQQQKLLKLTRQLIDEGKLEAAEQKFQREYRKLAAMAIWYVYQQRLGPMGAYDTLYTTLNNAILTETRVEARNAISKLRDQTRPDLKGLKAALSKATTGLGSSAKVDFKGKQVSGNELFLSAAKEWYTLHRAALRTVALHWAMYDRDSGMPPTDDVVKLYSEFRKDMLQLLSAVIEADASRATESESVRLYAEYIKGISSIRSVSRDEEFTTAFEKALEKLAAGAPSLTTDVTMYRGATTDWLRWRRRTSDVAARGKRLESAVILPTRAAANLEIAVPANDLISKISGELVGKEVSAAADFLVASKSGSPTSSYLGSMYCRALVKSPINDPTLESDLLVSPQHSPLTLEAASALAGLNRVKLIEVGGKVASVELVGMTPFCAIDSEDRKAVLTLGSMPKVASSGYEYPYKHVHLIVDIEPSWVRGEYFFVDLAGK